MAVYSVEWIKKVDVYHASRTLKRIRVGITKQINEDERNLCATKHVISAAKSVVFKMNYVAASFITNGVFAGNVFRFSNGRFYRLGNMGSKRNLFQKIIILIPVLNVSWHLMRFCDGFREMQFVCCVVYGVGQMVNLTFAEWEWYNLMFRSSRHCEITFQRISVKQPCGKYEQSKESRKRKWNTKWNCE